MRDLGTLPGDYASVCLGINDGGEVVGASLAANFSPRAVLWESDGQMADHRLGRDERRRPARLSGDSSVTGWTAPNGGGRAAFPVGCRLERSRRAAACAC